MRLYSSAKSGIHAIKGFVDMTWKNGSERCSTTWSGEKDVFRLDQNAHVVSGLDPLNGADRRWASNNHMGWWGYPGLSTQIHLS